jgi:chromosome segregation ATPase
VKRSTTVALREELRDAQAKVARLARECAGLRASGADNAHALDMVMAENARLRAENATLQADRSALTVERAEARHSRDLAEAAGAKTLALADGLQADLARWKAAMREGNERIIANAVSYGEIRGTLDVLTRLVLAGDWDAAKAVAQGIAGMVTA